MSSLGRFLRPSLETGGRLLAASAAMLFAVPLLAWFDAPIHRPQDEGMLLVYPELLLQGLLPHRDFLASYPPGNFYLLALCYQIFEPSVAVERSVGLVYRIVLILGIVTLGSRRSAVIGAICGITATVVLQPLRLEAFSWIGGLALLIWGMNALAARRPTLAGILLGLALWFRLDLAVAIALIIAADMWSSKHILRAHRRPVWFGLLATVLPLLAFLVVLSPQNAFNDLVLGPIFVTGPARRLPLSSLGTNSIRLLALLAIGVTTALLSTLRSSEARPHTLALAGLCVGLLPQAFQRLDADHLVYACCVVGSLLPATLDDLLDGLLDRVPILLVAAMVVLTTAGAPALQLTAASLEQLTNPAPVVYLRRDDRVLPARSEHEIKAFFELGTALDHLAQPGERLFIGPTDLSRTNYSDLHLYFLFPELVPASYFIELNPGSANQLGTRLTEDLKHAHWLLLSAEWDHWVEANSSREHGDSRPNQVVRTSFELIAQYGVWELYRRRAKR
jgi:hypothetical protein